MSQPDRSSNKDVVSEPENKVEEATDIAAEDRTAARNVHKCSSNPPTEFQPSPTLAELLHESTDSPTVPPTKPQLNFN